MPLFMDTHNVNGLTAETIVTAHKMDLAVQEAHGVEYLAYWFNLEIGRMHCLVHAPSEEAAQAVHREAHGLLADDLMSVWEGD